jgi:SPP1 gp7 family putative phage head morphogenesis protein
MFTFEPMPHEEAVKRIAGLPLVTREVMDGLLPELRAYAFCVTGLDAFDQLAKVRDVIAAVPAGEKTWEKAKREIAGELSDSLTGKQAMRRAELLLRTHTFRGYAASRYRLLMAQKDVFPFWQYKTHGDGNVRPSHAALNGKIFPAGHPIWQRIFPPWDWGCRCLVVPLLGKDVDGRRAADEGKAPENQVIYDGAMADAISGAGMLPNGIKLNQAPTWSASPWSEAGTVRHTWDLVKERYADTPEVLEAFEKWAKKVKLPDQKNKSVWVWLNGAPKRARKPKVLPDSLQPVNPGRRFPDTVAGLKVVKGLGGSTGAELVEDAAGTRFVMKRGASAEHLREEVLADEIYRALGVPVPEAKLYETASGPVKLARFIEGQTLDKYLKQATAVQAEAVKQRLGEHFGIDALMGNWDVIGLGRDNVLVDAAGLPWRIDNGGSLRFRAMGALKGADWNEYPEELFTLRDAAKNGQTAAVFGSMRLPDIARGIEGRTFPDVPMPAEVKDVLERRWGHLQDLATKALDMEHDGWLDNYTDRLCGEILALRQAGITADLPKQLKQAVGDVNVVDENGKLWDDLRGSKSVTTAPVKTDPYWADILSATKTLNYHAGTGGFAYNTTKVAAALKHKADLEKLAKGKGGAAKMAKHYLGQLGYIETGVAQAQAKQAFKLPQFSAWTGPVKAAAKAPQVQGSLVERLRDHTAARGGAFEAVTAWKSAQAGNSWNGDAQAKKAWVAKHLKVAPGKVYWQGVNQTATAEGYLKAMEKRLGVSEVDAAFTIHHAFVQELLGVADMRHSDRAVRALRVIRTENKALVASYGLKAGKEANCPRGLCESGSVFHETRVFGAEVTLQAVPFSRVLGSYLMEKHPGMGDSGFLGNNENEFTFIAANQPFLYQGSLSKVQVDKNAGNLASAWGVPTHHLRSKP